jgi:BirA family transcriptional regulator, biotin operon repressor / biotin---[acetyl-CoA-carboxylase] ligase
MTNSFPRQHLQTIVSTNAALMLRAAAGEKGPLWLTAGEQTGGRGRTGRGWASPPGNLYASLLLTDPCPMRHAPGLGFVAGVALIKALRRLAPSMSSLALKWPNDVLIGGRKLAGILPEARQLDGHLAIIIGMGVNCAFHPDDTPYPATSLAAEGMPVSPEALFAELNSAMAAAITLFDEGRGFPIILAAWREAAHGLGGLITVKPPSGMVSGLFEGVDDEGALLLRQDGALMRISAGDVYFGTPAALGAGEQNTMD